MEHLPCLVHSATASSTKSLQYASIIFAIIQATPNMIYGTKGTAFKVVWLYHTYSPLINSIDTLSPGFKLDKKLEFSWFSFFS